MFQFLEANTHTAFGSVSQNNPQFPHSYNLDYLNTIGMQIF